MALFNRKKKPSFVETTKGKEGNSPVLRSFSVAGDVAHILKNPRITEKATFASSASVYVFDVARTATKQQIKAAVERAYKVRPRKVRVVSIPTKVTRNMRTGQSGTKGGGKKAYVYLTKGETITIA